MSHHEGLEVVEAGRALKVQTDTPHLVSLGGGRLSTAVTLHPLPQGRVTIGTNRDLDIVMQGTGVEPVHCHIENSNGVVTLYPIAEMTTVDGLKVTTPTRLTQGCMLCIGRSNYLRFNHPAEARLMKSILPNARISMVPLSLYPGSDNNDGTALEKKPPMAPRRSPRDSWGEVSTSSSCASGERSEDCCVLGKVSRFELMAHQSRTSANRLQHFSPKVFPAGCPTANSPASAVLGPSRASPVPHASPLANGVTSRSSTPVLGFQSSTPNTYNTPVSNGVSIRSRSGTPTNMYNASLVNGSAPRSITPVFGNHSSKSIANRTPVGISRSVTSSPAFDRGLQHNLDRSMGSTRSLSGSNEPSPGFGRSSGESGFGSPGGFHARLATPSPAFNRNPLPYSPGSAFRSVTPSPPRSANLGTSTPVGHRRTMSAGSGDLGDPNLRVSYASSNCSSLEELTARNDELEQKRKQAQEARLREQEAEVQERARLEEILNMCAEYERQVQCERQQSKPPPTPTLQQNRIKTNGSLPRDKRLASPSATTGAAEDELAEIFTFETSSTSVIGSFSLNYSAMPVASPTVYSSGSDMAAHDTSTGPLPTNMIRSPYENVVINTPGTIIHPQSPRTRIRTIAPSAKDTSEVIENRLAVNSDYEFLGSLPRNKTAAQEASGKPDSNDAASTTQQGKSQESEKNKFILPLENGSPEERLSDMVDAMVISNKQAVSAPTAKVNGEVKETASVEAKVPSKTTEKKDLEKQDSGILTATVPEQKIMASQPETKTESEQRVRLKNYGEIEQLRRERGKLLATMSGLKRKVADIEQQEDELLRELDMERALLEGEWQAQNEKLLQEQERLSILRERVAGLDEEMEQCRTRELQRQADAKWGLEMAEREVFSLEQEASKCAASGNSERHKELTDKLRQQHELLEAERKAFEDLEFRQLEEEAGWLAGREELQRELVDMAARVEVRSQRLRELEQQRLEAAQSAQEESRAMERQLLNYLRRLEEGRNKQRAIEAQLAELTSGHPGTVSGPESSSPEGSSDADEVAGSPQHVAATSRKQSSQDDLDRISRVTSGAPIEIGTGSLGRRTLESLQEIERNRQRHLAQQGSQVIEEERKRVQELKRRVQDEVRAQWEERRQREANCNSLNSVGSEESSLTSSDVPTESASSDDALLSPTNAGKAECTGSGGTDDKNETEANDGTTHQNKMREKELELERDQEETRPLSDGSAYEQHLSAAVRKRDKASPRPQQPHQRPLTRYLPIRSESLNLRQHIESAGHQIELCPHVSLDSTSCRGYLHKMGSKFHHWNKRWFVFDRVRRTLTYYSDRGEKKPRGGAYFQSIEEVYVDHLNSVKSPNPQLTFVVKTNERTYHLMAPSPEAMRIWVDVIFTGAEGYQEFEHGS